MNENMELLAEVARSARMGREAVSVLMEKVGDESMRGALEGKKGEYERLEQNANGMLSQGGVEPAPTKATDRAGMWMGLQMQTMTDRSNTHIAQIMIEGAAMGVSEVGRRLNRCAQAAPEAKTLANEFLGQEIGGIERMRSFL